MALSSAFWAGAQTAYNGAQAAYAKVSDAVTDPHFNRDAYNEARRYDFANDDVDYNAEFDSDEEWTGVERNLRGSSEPEEPYLVQNRSANAKELRVIISRQAAKKASEAAGVSFEYAKWALKLIAVEASHDLGFLVNCKTATEAVKAVKARLPVLEDMQAAYQSGSMEGSSHRSNPRALTRTYAPQAGVTHPYDVRVPSNLDDIPIIADESMGRTVAARSRRPIYHPELRAELELVPDPVYGRTLAPIDAERDHLSAKNPHFQGQSDDVDFHASGEADEQDGVLGSVARENRLTFSGPIVGGVDSEELRVVDGDARTEYPKAQNRTVSLRTGRRSRSERHKAYHD